MSQQRTPELLIEILAVIVMLVFTVWVSWAAGPLLALAPLVGAIWLALQIKRNGKTKVVSVVVLSFVAVVAILVAIYFAWISGFSF